MYRFIPAILTPAKKGMGRNILLELISRTHEKV